MTPKVKQSSPILDAWALNKQPKAEMNPPKIVVILQPNRFVRALAMGPQIAGMDTNNEPTQAVTPLVSPKTSKSSLNRIPKENPHPSAITWAMKEEKTTIQPQPPSMSPETV